MIKKAFYFYLLIPGLTTSAISLATPVVGQDSLQLTQVSARSAKGAAAPRYQKQCYQLIQKIFHTPQKIAVTYSIDPQTLKMFSDATFMNTPVVLHPEGLSTRYAFMSDGVPASLATQGVERIVFSINHQYEDPWAAVLVKDSKQQTINCEIF